MNDHTIFLFWGYYGFMDKSCTNNLNVSVCLPYKLLSRNTVGVAGFTNLEIGIVIIMWCRLSQPEQFKELHSLLPQNCFKCKHCHVLKSISVKQSWFVFLTKAL